MFYSGVLLSYEIKMVALVNVHAYDGFGAAIWNKDRNWG